MLRLGYKDDVHIDEFQAYCLTEPPNFFGIDVTDALEALAPLRRLANSSLTCKQAAAARLIFIRIDGSRCAGGCLCRLDTALTREQAAGSRLVCPRMRAGVRVRTNQGRRRVLLCGWLAPGLLLVHEDTTSMSWKAALMDAGIYRSRGCAVAAVHPGQRHRPYQDSGNGHTRLV
eukprot:364480-Chlamydomonas_euryale.AAC.17